ncbi:MAG TPA: GNAT family N-acetyltransferase [Nocardioides sp.]|nr:GNAT family N-acetyltransferase [Nocardioides sp.]
MIPAADVLLSDGTFAEIREVAPTDGPALHELHASVSDDSLFLRFFGSGRRAAHAYVDHVLSSPSTLALVASCGGRLVGLATAEPTSSQSYEVAFLVADDLRGHGVGTLLVEHLADLARRRGIRTFTAEVLADNHRMLEVFTGAGFGVVRTAHGGECELRLDIADGPSSRAAADEREFAAEQRSLRPLLSPASVAVYGARRDGTGIGGATLAAILRDPFRGEIVVVRPDGVPVAGRPARRRLADGPPVDLAVLAVPVAQVRAALEDAIAGGVGAVVVLSSGFGEMGPEGVVLQQELGLLARRHGVRLVGPNCLGVLDNDPDVRLNATFGLRAPAAGGGLALASQSGGVGIALMDLLARAGVGVRTFVSLGNKVDVSGNDLLAAWYDDPGVTCAALYLESFGNARKFLRFARTFGARKPVVAVVGGRSAGGQRAGASHTAASATPALGVAALFAQAGVIACHDAEELADTVTLLTREPLPAGRRLGVVSNAGGLGVLAADAAEDAGLDVRAFSPGLQHHLSGLVSQTNGWANPVDAGAGTDAAGMAAIVQAIRASGEVDALVVVLVATDTNDVGAALAELAVIRAEPGIPLVAVPVGGDGPDQSGGLLGELTVMASARAAVAALGRAAGYAEWRRAPHDPAPAGDPVRAHAARTAAMDLMQATGPGWVDPAAASRLLDPYGVRLLGEVVPEAGAPEAAARLGFPVAVKAAAAGVVHRTERGLVATDLGSGDEVAAAVTRFGGGSGYAGAVLVQPMVSGVEVALGVVRDPALGPLVMVAAGGVTTDLSDDRVLLVPPMSAGEVHAALRRLRMWPLLAGFRGGPAAATDRLVRTIVALGRFAVDVPEVAELDLNPVLVGPEDVAVVDLKLRLAPGSALDGPRQLRPTVRA